MPFGAGLGVVSGERISPAELEMGERAWELRQYVCSPMAH